MKNEKRQRQLLLAIKNWQTKHGESPTYKELADVMGVSPQAVRLGVDKLTADGRIKRTKGRWRSLEITDAELESMTPKQMRAEIQRLRLENETLAKRLAQLLGEPR